MTRVASSIREAGIRRVDHHAVIATGLIHESEEPLPERLLPSESRYGHGGLYFWWRLGKPFRSYAYVFDGPFRLYVVNDFGLGAWHILQGFSADEDFNALLRELGPRAGLPADGPPWPLPSLPQPDTVLAVDYFRELHSLLRERLEDQGFDGYLAGAEVVVWNLEKLEHRTRLDPA